MLREKNPFIECARRFGKTTTVLTHTFEQSIKRPGLVTTWCAPNKNQAREIVMPEIEKLCQSAPKSEWPKWQTTDSFYRFPDGSKFKLRGVNEDKGQSARGPFSHIIVADEFGFWAEADNVVNSALRPQLLTTRGQFIFASTPAENLGHPYYLHKAQAIKEGRFVQKIIYDNESLSEDQIEEAAREVGGKESVSWKREYLCEEISDPKRLVIPEYEPITHDIPDDTPVPPHFTAYVGLDFGFADNTFAVMGYYDFLQATLVLEDEYSVTGQNSDAIAKACRAKEIELWGQRQPIRWGDNNLQQICDLAHQSGYEVQPTAKDQKQVAINALRLRFKRGQIKVKERCVNLRHQLRVGLWKESRLDFERGEGVGHLDGIMALVYLNRNLDESRNPFPSIPDGMHSQTHFIPSDLSQPFGNDALVRAFGGKRA